MIGATVPVALGAAVSFGASTALMHQGASSVSVGEGLLGLLRDIVRQWRWVAGFVASVVGLVLHALALHIGSLTVVQPIVVTGIVFSFIFRAALDGHAPSRLMMLWVLLTAAGLTVFLLAAGSRSGPEHVETIGAAIMLGAGVVVVLAGVAAARRFRRRVGLLLGLAAGVVYGLVAGTLKVTTGVAQHGIVPFVTSWPAYVLAALGAAGFVLNQRAYQQAPLSHSLPASNTVNPVVAVIFGAVAFGERPAGALGAVVAEALGLAGMLVGVFFLARTGHVRAQG